ncbi:hypothetical protein [uncultured Methanobrevibacter sp.]|nr:hypothetical protein [uncultured Methanobrevibacter sp.]
MFYLPSATPTSTKMLLLSCLQVKARPYKVAFLLSSIHATSYF